MMTIFQKPFQKPPMIEVPNSVLISKVTTVSTSDAVATGFGFARCWGLLPGQCSNHSVEKRLDEVLVVNSSSLLLLESRDDSTKFRVRKKLLLHEVDVDRGEEPGTLVVRRARDGARRDGSALRIRFRLEQDARGVYERTRNARKTFQAALDLLAIRGASVVQRLAPRLVAVVVDDTIVARGHPIAEISVKGMTGQREVEFLAESPMGLVSARVRAKELLSPGSRSHTLHLLSVPGDDGQGEYDGYGVELVVETVRVSRWRVGLVVAAAAVLAFFGFAVHGALQPDAVDASNAVDAVDASNASDGTAAFILVAAMLAFRVALAARRLELSLKVSSCSVLEPPPKSTAATFGDIPSFSRRLSEEHSISLRRSLVDGLDMTADELESSQHRSALARLNEISPAIDDDLFQRYVGACKGDTAKALTRLEATAHWRQANGVDRILEEANLPHFFTLKKHYLHCLLGRTKDGLPIVVEGIGRFGRAVTAFRQDGILPDHADQIIRQFVFHMEYIFNVVDTSAYPQGKFLRIYDMTGIKLRDISDKEAVDLGYQMMQMLEHHYCERMARALVIAPPIFSTIWAMVRGLVDPATAEKIKIVTPRKLRAALLEEMDVEVMPRCWGGNGVRDLYDSEMEQALWAWVRTNKKSLGVSTHGV